MNKTISKTLEPTGDLCIKFSEEELDYFGIKAGDKFSVSLTEDGGGILLTPYAEIEINLEEMTKDELISLIEISDRHKITIEEAIEMLVSEVVENLKNED